MIAAILESMGPLVIVAIGGLFAERAGILNIALEGCIAVGAFTAVLVLSASSSVVLGLTAAVTAGLLFGLLMALGTLVFRGNPFVVGLGINLLAPALAALVSQVVFGHKGVLRLPDGPVPGPVIAGVDLPFWVALAAAGTAAFVLARTAYGRRLRAAGERSNLLEERGISPRRTRMTALLVSSGSAALAGFFLALRVGAWVPGMSAGRGWIALVVIWLGFRRPWGIVAAALVFGAAEAVAQRAQGTLQVPATLLLALPYVIALVALTVATLASRRRKT